MVKLNSLNEINFHEGKKDYTYNLINFLVNVKSANNLIVLFYIFLFDSLIVLN